MDNLFRYMLTRLCSKSYIIKPSTPSPSCSSQRILSGLADRQTTVSDCCLALTLFRYGKT